MWLKPADSSWVIGTVTGCRPRWATLTLGSFDPGPGGSGALRRRTPVLPLTITS